MVAILKPPNKALHSDREQKNGIAPLGHAVEVYAWQEP